MGGVTGEVEHVIHDLESHADCVAKTSGGQSSFGVDSAEQGGRASGQFKQRGGLGSDPVEIFPAVGDASRTGKLSKFAVHDGRHGFGEHIHR